MKIILKQDIKELGNKDQIVDVKPGYARNYLLPRGLAVTATEGLQKSINENTRQASHKVAQIEEDARLISKRLSNVVIEVKVKADSKGKIFGSVTARKIAEVLKRQDISVDYKTIEIAEPIKKLGYNKVTVMLHPKVKHNLKIKVVSI